MNLRYLEILEAVEQAGTFTGAAKKLHLTQSAVSHAVAELEQQTGVPLFDRLPRGVRLTHYGMALLGEAQGILAACRSLDGRITHLEEYTPVNIVSSITIASYVLPGILSRLRGQAPAIRCNVRVASAARAMEILQEGGADIALLEGAVPRGPYHAELLGSYRLCAACAPDFLVPGPALSPKELCAFPLLLREPGSAIRDTFDGMLSLANLKAYPAWESVNSGALIKAAEAGLGITVLPELLLADSFGGKRLRRVELGCAPMENKMLAVRHREKYISASLQEVLNRLTETRYEL